MKVGIDSYCYHRFFNKFYPQQAAPPYQMTLEDFLRRASNSMSMASRSNHAFSRALTRAIWPR